MEPERGAGLTNLEYATLRGRHPCRPRSSTVPRRIRGTWESLERYASEELKEQWLKPLLAGEN